MNFSQQIGGDSQFYENLIDESGRRIRCCIPAVVQSYNPSNNTIECQPTIRERIIKENNEIQYINLPLLINVPVVFPSSINCAVKFPINRGDEVLVLFSDLSIDNFWEKGGVQNPIEQRRHDLSDGMAIPCCLSIPSNHNPVNELTLIQGSRSITFTQLYNLANSHVHKVSVGGTTYTTSTPEVI